MVSKSFGEMSIGQFYDELVAVGIWESILAVRNRRGPAYCGDAVGPPANVSSVESPVGLDVIARRLLRSIRWHEREPTGDHRVFFWLAAI